MLPDKSCCMTNATFFIIFLVVLCVGSGLGIVVPMVQRALRRGRGSIELEIPARGYEPGDMIEGTMQVAAERDLGPGRMEVALVCTEVWEELEIDPNGHDRRRKRSKEIYRQGVEVGAELMLRSGEQRTLPFTLRVPAPESGDKPSSGVGRVVRAIGDAFTEGRDRVWDVKAHYDIPGVDLSAGHRIDVRET